MTAKNFKCKAIAARKATGPAIISSEAICFYLVEPESGVVIEPKHLLEGRSLSGKVLIAHAGKGSSVVQMDGLFKIAARGNGPVSVILRNPDPVFVSALLVMELSSVYDVDEDFYSYVQDGDMITVDADEGNIIVKRP